MNNETGENNQLGGNTTNIKKILKKGSLYQLQVWQSRSETGVKNKFLNNETGKNNQEIDLPICKTTRSGTVSKKKSFR